MKFTAEIEIDPRDVRELDTVPCQFPPPLPGRTVSVYVVTELPDKRQKIFAYYVRNGRLQIQVAADSLE